MTEASGTLCPIRGQDGIGEAELAKIDPDFAEGLSASERRVAEQVRLRLVQVEEGSPDGALAEDDVFGAVVLAGMMVHQIGVAQQESLRLIGPGEVIVPLWGTGPLLANSELYVIDRANLALLDDQALAAIRRWPTVAAHLMRRLSEQSEETAAQMVIGHFPKVDDRVMAIMWLIAQRFGRVTPDGVLLPLALKHATIGALIGARRSTITLAIHRLLEDEKLRRVDDGWLLLGQPGEDTETLQLDDIELPDILATTERRRLRSRRSRSVQRQILPVSMLQARERAILRQVRAALADPDRIDPWTTLRIVERRLTRE